MVVGLIALKEEKAAVQAGSLPNFVNEENAARCDEARPVGVVEASRMSRNRCGSQIGKDAIAVSGREGVIVEA